MMAKNRKTSRVKIGDLVLLGKPGVSMPADWFIAKVLWTDGKEILTEHITPSMRDRQRQVLHAEYVLAIGTVENLGDFKRRASDECKALQRKVWETEAALGEARSAVWRKLDEISITGPVELTEVAV